MKDNQVLLVGELLREVYAYLCKKFKGDAINLSPEIRVEIAKDVDDKFLPRISYMKYSFAILFKINGKTWLLSRGEVCGNYQFNHCHSEIAAVPLLCVYNKKINKSRKIREALASGSYFRNSLICELTDGRIAVSRDSRFSEKMLGLIGLKIRSSSRYDPEFVKFLGDSIEAVLVSSSQ